MNERFFRDLSSPRIGRGAFARAAELIRPIESYIAQNNREPKPFIWTAKASNTLQKVTRASETLNK